MDGFIGVSFDQKEKMKLSIIIPSYNGKNILAGNLPFVVRALADWQERQKEKGEIIVVDDASTDDTDIWLKNYYLGVKVIKNSKNLRFGESCNRGMKEARGEIAVLLNNDARPEKDFLEPLIGDFKDQQVFAVGCREKNIENGEVLYGGRGVSAFERGLVVHWRPEDQKDSKGIMWVSGGSSAFRRGIWLKLGGFDKLFYPAYEEDRDICWQALKAGYKLIFESKSIVNHIHETTNRFIFGEKKIQFYSMKNQLLFVWKNISDIGLLSRHILWLPYHLTVMAIKTKGIFWLAFLAALIQLPEAVASREKARRNWIITDKKVLELS